MTQRTMDRIAVALAMVMVALFFIMVFTLGSARGQEHPNCTEFGMQIPNTCCCTNNCCTEAKAGEFLHIGGDLYRSSETGQSVRRTGWSPDGRTIKCACDLQGGKWTKHPKANVRCLWLPMPNS